jgi:hypothetical protein
MKRNLIITFALWIIAGMPAVGAQDDPKKVEAQSKGTPKEQFQRVLDAYNEAQRDFSQAYSKAQTDEERSKIANEKYPKSDEYARRFLAIADAAPDDPAAVDALMWHIRIQLGRGDDTSNAMRRLAEKHAADPRLARFVSTLVHSNSPSGEALLRAVIEKNRDRAARGNATMALARFLKNRDDVITALRGDEKQKRHIENVLSSRDGFDEAALARLKATDRTALAKEIESLFERVTKEFADVSGGRTTLGQQAAGELNEIRISGSASPVPRSSARTLTASRSSSATTRERSWSSTSGGTGEGRAGPCTRTSGRS